MEGKSKFDYDFSGKKILVVEDTLMSFKLMKTILSRVHADVEHACNGASAIEMCRENDRFDMVIMDLQMPGIGGLDATREIKKFRPRLPVIAATANTFDDEEKSCREAGCDGFITKPFKFERLFEIIHDLLQRQSH
jgi:two-component system cell cycle response regulator DivK